MPFLLRVFTPDQETTEVLLEAGNQNIGSADTCDIHFKHSSVKSVHVKVVVDGAKVVISPLSMNSPIVMNSKLISTGKIPLKIGDNFQIGGYVLELISSDSLRAPEFFRKRFDFLPHGMKLEARSYSIKPDRIFMTGDTMLIGKGGILLPKEVNLENDKVHELKFVWPTGQSRYLYGENMGDVEIEENTYSCFKLHKIEDFKAKKITNFPRSTWIKIF